MPITRKPNCKICQLTKTDTALLKRLYNSTYYLPKGSGESLNSIHKDYIGTPKQFTYASISAHVKKHQFISEEAYNQALLKKIDAKEERLAVRKVVKAVDAVQNVIDRGMERLENGEIDVNTDQLLRASATKLTAEAKEVDQKLAITEMIFAFSSGEASTTKLHERSDVYDAEILDYDPAIPITTDN